VAKHDPADIKAWLKEHYVLLFLRFNQRTDHAFAIVDQSDTPDPNLTAHPFSCRISVTTPRRAESDFLRMADFDAGTTIFDTRGWEKRLHEISRV